MRYSSWAGTPKQNTRQGARVHRQRIQTSRVGGSHLAQRQSTTRKAINVKSQAPLSTAAVTTLVEVRTRLCRTNMTNRTVPTMFAISENHGAAYVSPAQADARNAGHRASCPCTEY